MKVLFLFTLCSIGVVLCSCGGSGDSNSAIEGTWRGDLRQNGGLSCSDGTFIGACSGCVIGKSNLVVVGGDVVGDSVTAADGDCHFSGVRTGTGFTAEAASGCEAGLASISFRLSDSDPNQAQVSYHYDISKVQVGPGEIACISSYFADVSR